MRLHIVCLAAFLLAAAPASAFTVDFEGLGAELPIENPDSGEDEFFYDGFRAQRDGLDTDFSSGRATFNNDFSEFFPGCCWQGWAFSQTTDTTTPGFGNEFSAVPGAGVFGSATYGVAYPAPDPSQQAEISRVSFSRPVAMLGGYFTNTTYAALSMRNGDGFSKKFGGASGDDPDFFTLTVRGVDEQGQTTAEVEFDLADYRFEDNSQDYIVMDWAWLDLTALGTVTALEFGLLSSDVGSFGLNTPSYFALDDLMFMPGNSQCAAPPGLQGSGEHPSADRRCNLGRSSQAERGHGNGR